VTKTNHLIVFRNLSVVNSQNETNPTYEMYRKNTVFFNLIKSGVRGYLCSMECLKQLHISMYATFCKYSVPFDIK